MMAPTALPSLPLMAVPPSGLTTLCLRSPLLIQMLGWAGQDTFKPKHITAKPDAQVRSPRAGAGGGQRGSLATWQELDFEGVTPIYLDFGP